MSAVVLALCVLACGPSPAAGPPTVVFLDPDACEELSGGSCGFVMCDFVPEGRTLDEVCGPNFQEGIAPTGDGFDAEQLVVTQLEACEVARVAQGPEASGPTRLLTRTDGAVLQLGGTSPAIEAALDDATAACSTTVG